MCICVTRPQWWYPGTPFLQFGPFSVSLYPVLNVTDTLGLCIHEQDGFSTLFHLCRKRWFGVGVDIEYMARIWPWYSLRGLHIRITWFFLYTNHITWFSLYATFCFLWFTNCVLLFDKNLILGCLWLLVFVLNNILILGIWCSTIPHLPGCFCPWTFFENIGFNTVLTDPFMSHLATQLGYSAGEFQALQLIVLVAFGVVD